MNLALALLLALAISIGIVCIIMPFYIKTLKKHQLNQSVSEYALEEYKKKEKTPIMGGLVFIVVGLLSLAIISFSSYTNRSIVFIALSVILYCFVGFMDDILIIARHNNNGLSPKTKLIMELIITVVLFYAFKDLMDSCVIDIPFIGKSIKLPSILFLLLNVLLFSAEANAVNFTDGMDGLCAGVSLIALIPFGIIAYLLGNLDLLIMIVCFIGALFGYLLFNWHPAKIFMGDSGSLGLGALFASIAVVLNKEIALFFIGGVFVWEMFCVCLQLSCVKLFHKRVFSYTPIHYAFTLKGMKEVKVVKMFYLITAVLGIIGLIIGLN